MNMKEVVVKELNNDIQFIHINKSKAVKKEKINRFIFDFIKRLEELRELENKRINDFLK